ncbi:NAD(P)/FAD-dependent oxidoreductase [Thermoflavimicrobium dichotomicum]|uniref:2-polyprenyl-6-methoxyphenol hydroxylase n=1 Tax=Thermoflavimicrobium dichotomicum TaxID=46223 RepID=A0A1I3TFR6_9BACL|nr:NAD(P)/FAD-dependent oxidoreductase [Thermoflavimicrobium dichotomicum]SFJ70024.1 2-polyprenyl-6-methoxyphenol hydroxylase [Thermoflavimicrobium dichotomicum]
MDFNNQEYDVIIVGARVAGSSLAILLSKMGKRVLLIDRDRFPSDTLSTHHIGHVKYLRELGVLADVEALGLRRLTRWRTYIGDCILEGPHVHYALVPRRIHLDQILLDHALRYKTLHFAVQMSVVQLIEDNGVVVGVIMQDRNGKQIEARARIVVGADGKYSKIAKWVEAETYNEVPAVRSVYYAYFKGVTPLAEPATEIFLQDDRMGFIFPMQENLDCLVLEIHQDEFDTFRKNLVEMFETAFRRFYGMEKRMRNAVLEGSIRGTRGVNNYLRKPYGNGWALTGDAAYCKDPSTGQGINDAFLQSFLLAEALEKVFAGGDWEETMSEYHRKRDEAVLKSYQATIDYARIPQVSPNTEALLKVLIGIPSIAAQWAIELPGLLRNYKKMEPYLQRAEEMAQLMFGYDPSIK